MDIEPRAERIIDSAVELAERGGFEAVRLRDVASHAGVALGTLYRRFRSKEDVLIAALGRECERFEQHWLAKPPAADDALDRVTALFSEITRNFCRRPNVARALLRGTVSGDPELAKKVAGFHGRIEGLVVAALRGKPIAPDGQQGEPLTEDERTLAWSLEFVWFSLLVGWSGALYTPDEVVDRTREAAELMIRGSAGAAGA